MLELDRKESSVPKKWCFWTVVLEKTPVIPLDTRRSNKSILMEISVKYSLEGLMLKLKLQSFSSVQLLSRVWLFMTPWTAAHQDFLSFTISWVCSNSCASSRWCHPTISSSVVPFSSCPQSFPASGSFPMSQLFASGGQRIRASGLASVLPVNIQG